VLGRNLEVDFGLTPPPSPPACLESGVDVPALAGSSVEFSFGPIAPNPVRGKVDVSFSIPRRTQVTVDVYDVRGGRVRRLVDETLDSGAYSVAWDGMADGGRSVANGVYFVRLEADRRSASRKLVLLR
jgi:flagellar hook assembly protein FlgD